MATRAQKVKLGVFLIGGGAAFMVMLAVFAGMYFWKDYDRYHVVVPESVYGIGEGSPVTLMGVRVGSVDRIRLLSGSGEVRVGLQVEPGTLLHEGATAYLARQGVTGEKFVSIRGGDPERAALEPGSRLPYGRTTLDLLQDEATALLGTASRVIESTGQLVEDLSRVTAELDGKRVDALLADTQGMMREMGAASREFRTMIGESRQPVRETLEGVQRTAERLAMLTDRADGVLAGLDRTVMRMQAMVETNEDELRATSDNLRDASRRFKRLGRELRRKPSRLLFGRARQERELPDD